MIGCKGYSRLRSDFVEAVLSHRRSYFFVVRTLEISAGIRMGAIHCSGRKPINYQTARGQHR